MRQERNFQRIFVARGTSASAAICKFSKKTQTGCNSLNELLILQTEFRGIVDEMEYCKAKGYRSDMISYDIDSIAAEINKRLSIAGYKVV